MASLRRRALDLDALFESVDDRDEGFGGGDVGVLLAGQFDQFHGFVAFLAPGDEDLEGLALEGLELGLDLAARLSIRRSQD